MTGKILRNSYLVAISALLASALLFFGVMYRDYEDEAFARLRAETSAIAQGLGAQGASYFDGFEPDDRVTWVDASGSVLYDSAAPAEQLSNHTGREEIDRAVRDAQQYAAEDEKLKAEAVAKDRCEHLLYKAANAKPADKEQKAAIAEAAKTVKRAIKSRDSAQMVSAADQLESLLQQAGVNMDDTDSYQGSYENPNNSFEDDAMDADFEEMDK